MRRVTVAVAAMIASALIPLTGAVADAATAQGSKMPNAVPTVGASGIPDGSGWGVGVGNRQVPGSEPPAGGEPPESNGEAPDHGARVCTSVPAVTPVGPGLETTCAAPGQEPAAGGGDPVSAAALAVSAYSELMVPKPVIVTAPPRGTRMLVRMPTWFWLAQAQRTPRSTSASAGGVSVRITASAFEMAIDPGDGSDTVDCGELGVEYASGRSAEDGCTYAYERSGVYDVTVTVSWGADWAGSDGTGGTLPTISRSTTFPAHVVEARSELIEGP